MPDLSGLDLSNLTLVQVFGLLALTTLLDVLAAFILAVIHGDFSFGAVAIWIQSHTLKRVFPIFALAVVGHGIPQLAVPAIGPAYLMAIAGLTAYVIETVTSIYASFQSTTPPTDTSPIVPTPPSPSV